MDELLVDDFEVFHDVVREDRYDLWIGDGARSTPSCTRTLYEHLAACGIDGARRAALRLAELL